MLIREVLILNLPRRIDRKYGMLGHLRTDDIDVPEDRIRFFPAHDGDAYESVEDIIEDAMADGFPQYEIYRDSTEKWSKGGWVANWSYLSALRHIANSSPDTHLDPGRIHDTPNAATT